MRVKISSLEKRIGWPFKREVVEVHLTVDFTFEEKQIIEQRGLGETVMLQRIPENAKPDDDPDWHALRVKHLFERKPDKHIAPNPAAAKAYQAELTRALYGLKTWLDENAELNEPIVFEI